MGGGGGGAGGRGLGGGVERAEVVEDGALEDALDGPHEDGAVAVVREQRGGVLVVLLDLGRLERRKSNRRCGGSFSLNPCFVT